MPVKKNLVAHWHTLALADTQVPGLGNWLIALALAYASAWEQR
jgi:hypothetical protein